MYYNRTLVSNLKTVYKTISYFTGTIIDPGRPISKRQTAIGEQWLTKQSPRPLEELEQKRQEDNHYMKRQHNKNITYVDHRTYQKGRK